MADLLFNHRFKIIAIAIFLCNSVFAAPTDSNGEIQLSPSILKTSPYDASFTEGFSLNKKVLTKEEKEARTKAREEMQQKKLPMSVEGLIKNIKKGNVDIASLYLAAGISPNEDFFGQYPLFYAAKYNQYEIAKMLLEAGAKPNAGFDNPLFWAIKNNNLDMAKILIQYKVNVNYTELVSSNTILYTAIKEGKYEIAKELIKSGAKVDSYSVQLIRKKRLYNELGIDEYAN